MQNNTQKRKNNLYFALAVMLVIALTMLAFGAYSWLFALLIVTPFIIGKMSEEITSNHRKKVPVRVRDEQ